MGVRDVLMRAPLLLWRIRQTVQAILAATPDLVVLIDSQVFCQTVASQLRKRGYKGQIILYVAPSVWAWKPERAPRPEAALRRGARRAAVRAGGDEAARRAADHLCRPSGARATPRCAHSQPERGPLLLLARQPARRAQATSADHGAGGADAEASTSGSPTSCCRRPSTRKQYVLEQVRAWHVPVFVTSSSAAKWKAFSEAVAAVAVTGTVTLELALSGVPMVTTYVADRGAVVARHQVQDPLRVAAQHPRRRRAGGRVPRAGRRAPNEVIAELATAAGRRRLKSSSSGRASAASAPAWKKGRPKRPLPIPPSGC